MVSSRLCALVGFEGAILAVFEIVSHTVDQAGRKLASVSQVLGRQTACSN